MSEIQYILVIDGSQYRSIYDNMFADLNGLQNVSIVCEDNRRNHIKAFLLKEKYRKVFGAAFDWLGYEKKELYSAIQRFSEQNKSIKVIFINAAFYYDPYLAHTLIQYKKRFRNVSYYLLYLDTVDSGVCKNANLLREYGVFDKVITIDKSDAKRIRAKLIMTPYSGNPSVEPKKVIRDIYYCGATNDRADILYEIVKETKKQKVTGRFDIVLKSDDRRFEEYNDIVNSKQIGGFVCYTDNIGRSIESNCILDLVKNGQDALSLRAYEAVYYNKKLLTNNKSILEFPYYDSKFMRFFSDVNDIDWRWVQEKAEVNYHYQGDFSPVIFINELDD